MQSEESEDESEEDEQEESKNESKETRFTNIMDGVKANGVGID